MIPSSKGSQSKRDTSKWAREELLCWGNGDRLELYPCEIEELHLERGLVDQC